MTRLVFLDNLAFYYGVGDRNGKVKIGRDLTAFDGNNDVFLVRIRG